MSDIVDLDDFLGYSGGATGSYTTTQVQTALDIAEWISEDFLNTPLTPTQQTEEYPWPFLKALQLKKRRIITIDSVTALHYLDCDCSWTETTECAVIFDALNGIINPIACGAFPCCTAGGQWCGCVCPARIRVVYTAGFPSGYFTSSKVGVTFSFAISQITKYILPQSTSILAEGDKTITSWSSMDYSEGIKEVPEWVRAISGSPLVKQALNLLGMIKKKRFIGITGRGHP